MTNRSYATVAKVLYYQFLIILTIAGIFRIKDGETQGLSALLGGVAAFIPNLSFALWLYKSKNLNARKIVNSFYMGEAIKWFMTIAAFVTVFQLPNIHILPLLVCYVAALSVFWFALLMR